MLATLLITIIILLICLVLLSVKILFKKGGEFPNSHVGGNKALREKGIYCARTQHLEDMKRKNLEERLKEIKV
ncbi:hypothetical protein M2459_002200 [Parabacteroides sp. PF5-5]|uniref:hypothetical protein n=1 Tax=unclassified Parabacteroides TaxID=2649774 RepID=UPI002475E687|nr:MULTISPECIES: hypothetical protein [unclassified Parabacteroides]MDH6305103.1 hypothetical protein [Parabacteroides sp. PH5-39]MDH6316453.1 hypothetical protein [Parabacteroides sp. PF5-13]MDH6319963.1 hypothetical protein [Parabacteroides sp. PH5-13]MDH6323804.1 hypothetical protein [Parabacteroides sp. PH5-8]MDH6327640.1 hypothetical protein [Parabacteroides sp. PH5-41]